MPLSAILLDLDGTLVDTNRFHVEGFRRAFAEWGYDVTEGEINRQVGKGGDKLVPALIGEEGERKDGDALRDRAKGLFRDVLAKENTFELFGGVPALLRALRERGLRIALVTSSEDDDLDAIFKSVGSDLRDAVDVVTTASDVDASKPAPDVVRAALDKLGVESGAAAMVGDTVYDFEACERAGVAGLGVATWVWDEGALREAGARAAFADAADLLRRLDEGLASAR